MPRLKAFKWDAWADERFERFTQDAPEVIAVDTETSGVAYYDEPFCATLSWRGRDGSLQSAYIDFEYDVLLRRIEMVHRMLEDTPTWVFHNAKFDLQKLALIDALPQMEGHVIEDTQAIFHMLDENSPKGLKALAVTVLKYDDTIEVPYKTGPKKGQTRKVPREKHLLDKARRKLGLKVEDGYYYLPREVLIPYAIRDTEFTLRLYEKLKPALERRDKDGDLRELYAQEMELIKVFLRLEGNGMGLDLPYLEAQTSEYGKRVLTLWTELVELSGKDDFNPDSPKQILPLLAERGHKVEDTQEDTLKKLDDPLAAKILEYRTAKKIHKTYLVGLLSEQRDGVVHPHFNLVGARTGRMSSSKAHE